MPAARPRASFEPIPPDFDLHTFVETADNFQYVDRISYEMIKANGIEKFEKLVLLHVIIGGKPLVIDGFDEVLDPWTFTPSWLCDNHGEKVENARNLTAKENIPLTIKHYMKHMSKLTEQFFDAPERYRDKTRQRIYLKDIDCPPVWQDKLKEHIPHGLFYLNESTGELGGPGATDKPGFHKGRGIGRAGDLMSSLPLEMRAENLMCYIGHEGTYTPSHREMCASLGQNIMVNNSATIGDDGQPERPGSSIWFMTETKDRHLMSEYWLSVLGHDIEVENHFAQLTAWKKAPFKTYVVEQRAGDFILIPPLAPHQVWNRGTRTMKIAWNRTTVETLELALSEALPNSRVVCRDEQYKNKAIVYYTLLKYSQLLKSARTLVEKGGEQADAIQRSMKVRQVQRDFKRLFDLFKGILLSEMFLPESREQPELIPFDSNVTCAYCRCNVFNRFLTCKSCKNLFRSEMDEPYDVCMDCYCMGRSCRCQSGYSWAEQWKWTDLIHTYEKWRAQILDMDGQMTEKTPLPLSEERRYLGKKTLAQVCQEQLKTRPFVDIKNLNLEEEEEEEEEVQVDEYGMVKKPPKKKSKLHKSCHFCLHRHPKWKMAFCSNCDLSYCYGALFRAHDMMPLSIMENPNWKCPHCRRVCNTGACRRDPRQNAYEPKGTLLGHDTKQVADPRSVECLVDFSISNLNWMREEDGAMQRRREEAEREKLVDPSLDDRYMDDDHDINRDSIAYSPGNENGRLNNSTTVNSNSSVSSTADRFSGHQGDETELLYPDPDQNGEIPRLGKRNHDEHQDEGTIKDEMSKKKQKKNKDGPSTPLRPRSMSGKEYQKEIQRKVLEEAKREDRFNLVDARMKGNSKVVKLTVSSDLLEAIVQRHAPAHPVSARQRQSIGETMDGMGSIPQSNVLSAQNSAGNAKAEERGLKTYRYRITENEAYTPRNRNPEYGAPTPKSSKSSRGIQNYDEVTIDSDEEEGEDDIVRHTEPGTGHLRKSNWLDRKNLEEEDVATELPPSFKDGDVNLNRRRNRERQQAQNERRKTILSNPKVHIHPSDTSTNSISDQYGVHNEDDLSNSTLLLAQPTVTTLEVRREDEAGKARTVAIVKEVDENLRAKMGIAERFEDSENELLDGFMSRLTANDEQLARERDASAGQSLASRRIGPTQLNEFISTNPRMEGKKIKIISAHSNRNGADAEPIFTTIPTNAPLPGFSVVHRNVMKTVNWSDGSESDGEDEIPAKAPNGPKGPLRRPMVEPSVILTRGDNEGKRGRGRPRKTS